MVGESTIGPDSQVERILDDYGLGATSWPDDLVENDTDRLLLALLLEQRGQNALEALDTADDDSREAGYFVTEDALPVTSTDEEKLNWGFSADSVTVWGFDEPLNIAFRSEGEYRKIPLQPSESPFTVAPEGGIDASSAWIRKMSSDASDTTVKVLALQ
ncbi:hypothetical protein [Natrinema versiforme]|uniref:Uncharacterized protein n=2 Tax=root TaxID=1 RepID=A0A4P8WNR1_9EURY|nr:hypothetical protein [Natrinema versiforme]YP_010772692.1 hypothetical protein QIT49_gp25 [Natrinema versiforme icosahedral virus 1]QCS45114.1 hypothetical protein FEJ81_22860 [Natrinema versiforme]DAC85275.1 TPA_asm: hypothetical protein NVIV1gp10 [Natrinema versiforme icosahedral virus 1]